MGEARRRGTYEERRLNPKGPNMAVRSLYVRWRLATEKDFVKDRNPLSKRQRAKIKRAGRDALGLNRRGLPMGTPKP